MHSGLDFRATSGTPVKVTADGKVIQADWVGGYGRLVEVDHGFGLTTRYAHLSGFEVEVGDAIRKGAIIGYVGSTGRSTGPHLHYEVRIDDEAVDPLQFRPDRRESRPRLKQPDRPTARDFNRRLRSPPDLRHRRVAQASPP